MPNTIFIKLADSQNIYKNERLNVLLIRPQRLCTSLEYTSLNDDIFKDLASGIIIQISEADYYNLINQVATEIQVPENYLLTLSDYLQGNLNLGDVFFILRGQKLLKVDWELIQTAMTNASKKFNLMFKPGDTVSGYTIPAIGATSFQSDKLKGITIKMDSNGVGLPKVSIDDPSLDCYIHDNIAGTITRASGFKDGEIVGIYQID